MSALPTPPPGDAAGSAATPAGEEGHRLEDRRWWWVVVLVAATLFWSGGGVVARAAPIGGPQLAFWRSLVAAALYQGFFALRGGRMRVETLRSSLLGGIGFGLSVTALFAAYRTTSFVSVGVIGALQPLMLVPISARAHGHRVGARGLALIVAAVIGTALVVVGATSEGSWSLGGDLLALLGVLLGCGYAMGTKDARRTLGAVEYLAAAMTVSAVATLPGAVWLGDGWVWPDVSQLLWAVLLVAVGGTGHLLYAYAQRFLPVVTVSTIVLLEVVELAAASVIFFDESLGAVQFLGIAVSLVALGLFVRHEADLDGEVVSPTPPLET